MFQYSLKIIFIALLSFKLKAIESSTAKYDIRDLEVLEKEKNYTEFLNHAFDIRPSLRTKQWQKMYQNMAVMMIEDKINNRDYSLHTFSDIERRAKNFPLISDEIYAFKRNLYAQNYFKECYFKSTSLESTKTCDKDLLLFWENSNHDADLALNFINYINETKSPIKKWIFYSTVVNDQIAPIYCKKNDVINAIMSKVSEETFTDDFDGNYKKILQKNIPEKCLKETYPTLKEILTSTESNGLDKELAFSILEAKDQLSTEDKEFYYALYLFSGPVTGEKMNIAWTIVEKLGESFKHREKILIQIKNLNYLSDRIFVDPNLPRNKAIINHFARNFPELLEYYAENCLGLIKGKDGMKANSLVSCNNFLKTAKTIKSETKLNWVSDSVEVQYGAIKKF